MVGLIRMGKEDGGLTRHRVSYESGIDWNEARIVACEYGLRQRKTREGIESLREKIDRKIVFNNYEQLTAWRPTLEKFLDTKCRDAASALPTPPH